MIVSMERELSLLDYLIKNTDYPSVCRAQEEVIENLRFRLDAAEQHVKILVSQRELLENARAAALHEGDMNLEQEAELIHRNLELEQEVAKYRSINKELSAKNARLYAQYQKVCAARVQLIEQQQKVPKFVRRIYGVGT